MNETHGVISRASDLDHESITAAIERLASKRKAEAEEAEALLRRAGMAAFQQLVEARDRVQREWRRQCAKSMTLGYSVAITGFVMLINTPEANWPLLTGWTVLSFGGMFYGIHRTVPPKSLSRMGGLLCDVHDIRALGPLTSRHTIDSRTSAESSQRRELAAKLFAKIRASDSAVVTDEVRAHMHYLLRHWEHFEIGPGHGTDYYCAVLSALEQVGEARSIPFVRYVAHTAPLSARPRLTPLNVLRLAYNGLWTATAKLALKGRYQTIDRKRLAEAAQDCLAALEARSEDEREAVVLLRPASATAADALLRPALSSKQTADELLKAFNRSTAD